MLIQEQLSEIRNKTYPAPNKLHKLQNKPRSRSTFHQSHLLILIKVSLTQTESFQFSSRSSELSDQTDLWRSSLCCAPRRSAASPGRQCGKPRSGSHKTCRPSRTRAQRRADIFPGTRTRRARFPPSAHTAGLFHSRSCDTGLPLHQNELQETESTRFYCFLRKIQSRKLQISN